MKKRRKSKNIIISCIVFCLYFITICNSVVYAERYDTGDKVIYTDKYGRATQIIDKSTFPKASDTALEIENIFSIIFFICLVGFFVCINKENRDKKIETLSTIFFIVGTICLVGFGLIYFASGGWAAH